MRQRKPGVVALAGAAVLTLASCSAGGSPVASASPSSSRAESLSVLIGSSGDAETAAVQAAADAWSSASGVPVEVTAASDLTRELAQGFAGDSAPDVFELPWDQFPMYAADGFLEPYAEQLFEPGRFPPVVADTFTDGGRIVCAPSELSTLGLVINTALWDAAGLTEADIPTTWEQLHVVAQRLTGGSTVGLSMDPEYERIGVFLAQAGGGLMDGVAVTAQSPQNLAALEYLQGLLASGALAWPADVGADSAAEAFGGGSAAMVVEGPAIAAAIEEASPGVQHRVVELPAGPAGPGTFAFSSCWGIAEGQATADTARELVAFLASDEQQLALADASDAIPPMTSAAALSVERHPDRAAFVRAVDHATAPIAFPGAADVLSAFDGAIAGLEDGDAAAMLGDLQESLETAYESSRR